MPKAVKSIAKNAETVTTISSRSGGNQRSLQPGRHRNDERDIFEYDNDEPNAGKWGSKLQAEKELKPCIMNSLEESFEESSAYKNLVVNLEDIVNEEYYINRISEQVHK